MGRLSEDMIFDGTVRLLGPTLLPEACIGSDQVDPARPIGRDRLQHEHRLVYSQASGSAASAETRTIYRCHGAAGQVVAITAGCVVPCVGNATITIDVLKDGSTSLLDAPIVLDESLAAHVPASGVLVSSPTLAAGDALVLEVTVDAGTGTLGQGLDVALTVQEGHSV